MTIKRDINSMTGGFCSGINLYYSKYHNL